MGGSAIVVILAILATLVTLIIVTVGAGSARPMETVCFTVVNNCYNCFVVAVGADRCVCPLLAGSARPLIVLSRLRSNRSYRSYPNHRCRKGGPRPPDGAVLLRW